MLNLKTSSIFFALSFSIIFSTQVVANGWPEGFETPNEASGWDAMGDPLQDNEVNQTPYAQNDTRDVDLWKIYISNWVADPPNAVVVIVNDHRPLLTRETIADLIVTIGDHDDRGQFFITSQAIITDLELLSGPNRVTVYVKNEPYQVVHANLKVRKNIVPIKPLD